MKLHCVWATATVSPAASFGHHKLCVRVRVCARAQVKKTSLSATRAHVLVMMNCDTNIKQTKKNKQTNKKGVM